jgi:hypothetical protein
MKRASFYVAAVACLSVAATWSVRPAASQAAASSTAPPSLNYEYFKAKVEPIFLAKVVVPGFEGSKLVVHPLAEEAGGDPHHGGGQQFASKDDPEWLALKAFALGATLK